jgi:hypothetical protein
MRGYYRETWRFFIKKIINRTLKTALFIDSQAEQFSNVRKKRIIYLDVTTKTTTYGKRFQKEHYQKCLTSVQFYLWLLAELYLIIFFKEFPFASVLTKSMTAAFDSCSTCVYTLVYICHPFTQDVFAVNIGQTTFMVGMPPHVTYVHLWGTYRLFFKWHFPF